MFSVIVNQWLVLLELGSELLNQKRILTTALSSLRELGFGANVLILFLECLLLPQQRRRRVGKTLT